MALRAVRTWMIVLAVAALIAFYAAPLARINAADVMCMASLTEGTYTTALVPYPVPHWECRTSSEGVSDLGWWR